MKNIIRTLKDLITTAYMGTWNVICDAYSSIANEIGINLYNVQNSIFLYSLCAMFAGIFTTITILFFIAVSAFSFMLVLSILVFYFKYVLPLIIVFSIICLARWHYLRKQKMNSGNETKRKGHYGFMCD